MKKYLLPSIMITGILSVLLAGLYPLFLSGIAKFVPGNGDGEKVMAKGRVVGYANVGQKFTDDKYFQGRPSAVDYNAAGSGGSNKGPSNPDYLKTVQERIDTFMVHNPTVKKEDIPAELVTASGSGLDPDLSPAGANAQAPRIAKVRGVAVEKLYKLIDQHTENQLFGLGPQKVNVLKLNVALDELK
ncbi:potassium-transporting ATPase subunit KdpC [Solitalea canadensis]|uniref:Potassium-transporting ATPase KdpC subunit n=1 Tax=Solitalea canadensis (strain ATCC 29591 / DSM 3403 / JCM 21819 / LMG 8368 / NBRC 15130 / NCIMB 12057 / USAM 9D) TaxID=929556 RepID=H8KMI2_SOLCM|nr:potassium-transporting ATPase subunit KdpC [Solitalea canadensis]AFD08777.1 K+-transporting ATPase, C subunit [Solitalea canadensis DSM 3403]